MNESYKIIMIIKLNDYDNSELDALVEIYDGCYSHGVEVTCFKFIKNMVNNEIETSSLSDNQKSNIKQQIIESREWFLSMNVSTETIDKLLSYFE